MEERILKAEAELETCRAKIADPNIATQHLHLQDAYVALKAAEQQVEGLYARWAELEDKLQGNH